MLVHPRYESRELLGQGAQGAVVRVVDRETPDAALVAKVWTAGKFDRETLAAEFALLSRQRIRGLARAWDFGFDEKTNAATASSPPRSRTCSRRWRPFTKPASCTVTSNPRT